MRIGVKEDSERFWEVARACDQEAAERAEDIICRGVDGGPIPTAP
jgi:hypothetical protein